MRLTLRTMLAYLDEILEPDDQAEIGHKIEESEFASDLARRTRDVIGKLRLGAPTLSGRGVALNPNTVAEYLDNSLAAERVADFERACLESDVCLAEVAACHQILTLVLGQPAEVGTDTRERIYALGTAADQQERGIAAAETAEPAPVAAPARAATPPSDGNGGKHHRRKPEIPEYLRESRGSAVWRFVAAAVVIALLLGGAALVFVGPGKIVDSLRGGARRAAQQDAGGSEPSSEATPPAAATASGPQATADQGAASGPPEGTQLEQPSAAAGQPTTAAPAAPTPADLPLPEEGKPADQGVDRKSEPKTESPPSGGDPSVLPATGEPAGPDGQKVTGEDGPLPVPSGEAGTDQLPPTPDVLPGEPPDAGATAASEPGDSGAPLPETPSEGTAGPPAGGPPPSPDTTADATGTTYQAGVNEDPSATEGSSPAEGTATRVVAPVNVGVYSNTEVLLSFDEASGQWRRLPLRAAISADERLLALPSFRPQVTLTSGSGVTLDMVGPASIILQMDDPAEGPGVNLLYGRIILLNVGQAGNHFALQIGDQRYVVEFGGVGATLAIEVARHHVPGSDPEAAPAPVVAAIHATSGKLKWQIAGGDAVTDMVAPGQWRIASGQLEPVPDAGPPADWINAGSPSGLELRSSMAIDDELSNAADRPVSLVLQELVDGQRSGRRSEVRSLAARCAVHVGEFEPFVEALNDPEQKTWRSRLIESLEEALALGPDVAAAIRQAFIKQHGEEAGAQLYRLLQGYSKADLERGADKQLVDYLQHDQLDFRLLALWNLIRITGLGQTNRLQDPKASRFQIARRWEQRLKDNEIIPAVNTP